VIQLAKDDNWLYLIENVKRMHTTKSQIPLPFMSETNLSNIEKIWLYHLRLHHPSFSTLEIMFPNLFQKVDKQMSHGDTCEFVLNNVNRENRENELNVFYYITH